MHPDQEGLEGVWEAFSVEEPPNIQILSSQEYHVSNLMVICTDFKVTRILFLVIRVYTFPTI